MMTATLMTMMVRKTTMDATLPPMIRVMLSMTTTIGLHGRTDGFSGSAVATITTVLFDKSRVPAAYDYCGIVEREGGGGGGESWLDCVTCYEE
jgi:hypothetical protein|eukprot:COSAG01_NODE_7020_length_3389_cov_17.973252_2_plen_93_part_00